MELQEGQNSFTIALNRVVTKGELTVNLETTEEAETPIYSFPQSVTFQDGEATALIKGTVDPANLEAGDLHKVTLKIADVSYVTPYGPSEYRTQIGVPEPWESIGNALYREDLVGALFGVENLEYEVEIQKHGKIEGLYRLVNPYCSAYPYNDPPDYDESTNHYMVIHAEDPDHVWFETHYSGMDWGYGEFRFTSLIGYQIGLGYSLEDLIASSADLFGTMVDGVITMPVKSMLMSMADYNDGGWFYANGNGLLAVALPGASLVTYDYSAVAQFAGILKTPAEENQAVIDFTLGEDVATAKYAMTSADVSEAAAAQAIVSGELESEEIKEGGRYYLPLEVDGKYRVTIVTYDADGKAQESASTVFEFEAGGSSWESLGLCSYTDDLMGGIFTSIPAPITYDVEVLASTKTPGLYRMKNPYGEAYPYNDPGDWDDSMDYYIEIDASDPNAVTFAAQELGVDWGYGMISAVAAENGKLEGGVITFPESAFYLAMTGINDGNWSFYGNKNGAFKLVLPGSSVKAKASAKKVGRISHKINEAGKISANKALVKTKILNAKSAALK